MQNKVFWISFSVLGILLEVSLPLMWSVILTIPLLIGCWWVAYRSDWFD